MACYDDGIIINVVVVVVIVVQSANAEMCVSCNKRVYATERLGTGDVVYHKACFRCAHCKKTLRYIASHNNTVLMIY